LSIAKIGEFTSKRGPLSSFGCRAAEARLPTRVPALICSPMPKFEFCIPTVGKAVPARMEWFHEIKYDGYRLRIERDGSSVRLISRGGYDWSKRFPWIAEAALKNRRKRFVIDGEAVIPGADGMSDFNALHSSKQNTEVQLCAFDVLAIDGDDLRELPLAKRKVRLERLLRGWPDGIFVNPFEVGAIGPDLFQAACSMGRRGWCRSAAIGRIGEDDRLIGLR
jgi:bifunctional non-homologous end joining protein LigD